MDELSGDGVQHAEDAGPDANVTAQVERDDAHLS